MLITLNEKIKYDFNYKKTNTRMKNKITLIMISIIFITSCENKIALTPNLDDFMVSVESATVKVGDSVRFHFKGNPDLISFYSGEPLHQYEFKDGRIIKTTGTTLAFKSAVLQLGQDNQLSVLVSTDYNNQGNGYTDIVAAQWAEITDRFIFGTSGVYKESEEKDISDVIKENQPFYIGFRYTNKISEGNPRRWFIQGLSLRAKTESVGDIELSVPNNFGGYELVEQFADSLKSASSLSVTTIILEGNPDLPNDIAETWAISPPFITGEFDYGPDRPIGIKGFDSDINTYSYIYTEPGVYNVVFVAKNINVDQEKEITRNIQIIVEE